MVLNIKKIKSIFCKLYIVAKNILKSIRAKIRNILFAQKYSIIKNPGDYFQVIAKVSEASWETMYTPEIYEIAKERTLVAKYPKLVFYNIPNATININSDIIITEKGVWWDKFNEEDFITLAEPGDENLIKFDHRNISILPAPNKERIKGRVLSITGVYSYAWSHCLFQFISKLFCAGEAGLLEEDITLVTNDYHDENIEYILNNYLKNYPKVKRIIAKNKIDYTCDELLAIQSFGSNYNEAKVYWDYRLLLSHIAVDKLHEYISNPIIEKIKDNPAKYKKLYLARHSNRKLTNTEEIEQFFKDEGFYFVEGAELTLVEKVDLFYHAEIIAGLHSSAWQNLIFANDAKCLMLVNNRYAPEMVFYTMAKNNVQSWLNVVGQDVDDSRRSDFTISLDVVKNAYSQLLLK